MFSTNILDVLRMPNLDIGLISQFFESIKHFVAITLKTLTNWRILKSGESH